MSSHRPETKPPLLWIERSDRQIRIAAMDLADSPGRASTLATADEVVVLLGSVE